MSFIRSSTVVNTAISGLHAITYAPIAGNFLLVAIHSVNPTDSAMASVTDDGGSTYSASINEKFSGNHIGALYYCQSANAGVTTITINFPTTVTENTIAVLEFSPAPVSPSDGVTTVATGSTALVSTSALTPSVNADLSIGLFYHTTNSATQFTTAGGYTVVTAADTADGDMMAIAWLPTSGGIRSTTAIASVTGGLTWWAYQALYMQNPNPTFEAYSRRPAPFKPGLAR